MVQLLKKDGKTYIELPEDFKEEKIKAVKLDKGVFLVTTEEKFRELLGRQIRYLIYRAGQGKQQGVQKPQGKKYWVFPSEEIAQSFSRENADKIKKGELLGVKGFDGKYYIVRADAYYYSLPKIVDLLQRKGELSVEDIAKSLNEPADFVKSVLELAREEGIVYEVRHGVYRYAG